MKQEQLLLEKLWSEAREARTKAYAPYSNFLVGAAVLSSEGKSFSGCNVENSAYPSGICAERTAIFKAVSEGHQKFSAVAIVTDSRGSAVPPCGACLQVLSEFCDAETTIILGTPKRIEKEYKLIDLLPAMFLKKFL